MGMQSRISIVAGALAILMLAGMVVMLLALVGRPLATADLWFHLKMGEWYLLEGLWPTADPMLHTNGSITPVQHEWLFGVWVHSIEKYFGFQGLRIANVLSVILIIGLAFDAFRRQAGSLAEASLATGAFIILSWLRLMQDRPDRWSIISLLLLYRFALDPEGKPSRYRLFGTVLIMLLWVNAHSLFAIGLALLGVAMVGQFFEAQLRAQFTESEQADSRRAKVLFLLLCGCFLITLLNPRGIWQHLTFFTSSTTTAVWAVSDEWLAFYPFSPGAPNSPVLPWLTWLVADVVLVAFLVALIGGYMHLRRYPKVAAIRACDPTLLLLAIVSIGALLVSFRFLWLGFFPLLFILRVRREIAGASTVRGDQWVSLSAATASLALLGLLLTWPNESGAWTRHMSDVPEDTDAYLNTPVNHARYAGEGTAFIREAGLTGNLFNNYTLGAYIGFHVAPSARTFIDGRAEHYPPEVMIDYDVITAGGTRSDGRHYLDILRDRDVDLFFGVGGPGYGYMADDTLHHLEAVPWYTLIFRSAGHGLWLRKDAKNQTNLERVSAFYRQKGISFSPETGLDVGSLIRNHLDYAIAIALVPAEYPSKLQESQSDSLDKRLNALAWLGDRHRIAGDYEGALAAYGQIMKVNPRITYILEQSIRCLVALGRFEIAQRVFLEAQGTGMPAETLAALEAAITRQAEWRTELAQWRYTP